MTQERRALIKMPDVQGLPLRKAKLIVENFGLKVDGVLFEESYDERDTVLRQTPTRGLMVYMGEKVTLYVSRESYVKWLPSIYQRADVTNRNFIRDLLWITQHLFGRIHDTLDVIHTFFDPLESPAEFMPWLASWTAMVLEEDWPIEKKRLLVKKAIELYKIRGTVKGLKLFIALFTGHEPNIVENKWPYEGFRVGVTSGVGIDTVILPPVNKNTTFLVEMPKAYKDISVESVIRLHEIIQMEKPAHASYCLTFLAEERPAELREFFIIGARSGIGIRDEIVKEMPAGGLLAGEEQPEGSTVRADKHRSLDEPQEESVDEFRPVGRGRAPLPKAPRATDAPVEGQEVRTNLAGGFEGAARAIDVAEIERLLQERDEKSGRPATQAVPAQSTDDGPTGPKAPKKA